MVKVTGPCFSLDASGNLADALNYCLRNEQHLVRKKFIPLATVTSSLARIQGFMRHTIWTWQHLTPSIQEDWNMWASTYKPDGSGFNSFTSYYMRNLIDGQIPPLEPT